MKKYSMNEQLFVILLALTACPVYLSAQDINDEMMPSSIIELPVFHDENDQTVESVKDSSDASIENVNGADVQPGTDLQSDVTPASEIEEPQNFDDSADQAIEHVADQADADPEAQEKYDEALENSAENIKNVPPEMRVQLEDPTDGTPEKDVNKEEEPDEAIEEVAENTPPTTNVSPLSPEQIRAQEIERDRQEAKERELVQRQYFTKLANTRYEEGRQAFINGDFEKAVSKYQDAISEIMKTSKTDNPPIEVEKTQRNYRLAISQAYEAWADELIAQAEVYLAKPDPAKAEKAKELLEKAQKIYPECANRIAPRLTEAEKLAKSLTFSVATSTEGAYPDYADDTYQISVQLRRGAAFYKDKNYDAAREMYENVLRKDPYNREAANALRKINFAALKRAEDRQKALRRERISEVNFNEVNPLPARVTAGEMTVEESPMMAKKISKNEQKLQSIIIDHIAFEDIPLSAALRHLSARSKEIDPQKEGVNFFLRVKVPDAEGENGTEASNESADDFFRVSLIIDAVPLSQVIDLICKAATRNNIEVKKNVEDYAVVIYSSNVPIGMLETRIWPIENPPSDLPENDPKGLVDYFTNMGVQFPDGSRAIYDKDISRLIVTNTSENISRIDQIIEDFKGAEPQVLIEARFVEIAQKDLKELGFDWMITRNPPDANSRSIPFRFGTASQSIPASTGIDQWVADPTSPTGYRLVEITQPTPNALRSIGNNGLGNGLIPPGQVADKAFWWRHTADRRTGDPLNPNVPNNWGSQLGTDVDFAIRALSQCQTADLLATPRVTTMNGEAAMIRMVTEVYYPTEWTEPQTFSMNNNNFNFNNNNNDPNNNNNVPMGVIGSVPLFGDPVPLGITLEVTPYVSQDFKSISLEMNPVILDFAGWNEYSYELDVNGDGQIDGAEKQILKMPIIETRQVTTTIRVDDGETLILGGALRDKTYTMRDKIPLLGDVPIVGRLFRTDGSWAEKTNLLIFVNCRLVHPDGQPIRGTILRGVPSFRR